MTAYIQTDPCVLLLFQPTDRQYNNNDVVGV